VSVAGPALLVVDDNDDNRYTLTRRLTREGYTNLTTAANGREALDLLQAKPFDLILLDIMMPDMNGYEVLECMKAGAGLRDIPVIMISAPLSRSSVKLPEMPCSEGGAPVTIDMLFGLVKLGSCERPRRYVPTSASSFSRGVSPRSNASSR